VALSRFSVSHVRKYGTESSFRFTAADVMALIRALRGLVQATQPPTQEPPAQDWQRFLGMHLAGMRAAHPFGPSCL
jgi:hypothetical protein